MKWPCIAAAAATVALRLAVLPWLPVPEPRTHDEFAYLLGAETFLSGRLTNPTPPLWEHFETFHVNMVPTYQMKYPPAQSLALAAGTLLFGHPFAGVVAMGAAMAAAICWMLLVWVPARWAFAATFALMLQTGIFGYWMGTYWGGSLAAAGGALVMGSVARLIQQPRAVLAAVGAFGVVLLALSRPFEGAVFSLISGAVALAALRKSAQPVPWTRIAVPAVLIGIAAGALLACYHDRVTGHPAKLPYQEYQKQYAGSPVFLTQADFPMPVYRHAVFKKFWEWDRKWYLWAVENPWFSTVSLLRSLAYYLPLPATLALLWGIWKRPRLGALLAVFFAVLCLERWLIPHYLAPAAGMIALLAAIGIREMNRWLATGVIAATVLIQVATWKPGIYSGYRTAFVTQRRNVLDQLSVSPGRHLVLVRYSEKHDGSDEWVYNSADIAKSTIVWAREMSPAENTRLRRHFQDRTAWLLEADAQPARLTLFDSAHLSTTANTAVPSLR